MLTTKQAAERLGYQPRWIRALLERGTLKGIKSGRDWMAYEASVRALEQRQPLRRGRPRRQKAS